jgi:hypothetical protein
MTIYKVKFSKEKLRELPADECALFLSLAHLSNEIVALDKLIIWSYDFSSENEATTDGQIALCMMLIKLLSGKLKEGYELLTKKFFGTKLSREYEQSLPDEGKEILSRLKRYFSTRNSISFVRNNYAFHYSPDELNTALPSTPEDLVLYFEEGRQENTLNYFAEAIANRALLQSLGYRDDHEAFDQLINESTEVAGWILDISSFLMGSFILRYRSGIMEGGIEKVSFDGKLPLSSDIRIPWFTDNSVSHLK